MGDKNNPNNIQKSNNPKVSIIVATYRRDRELERALISLSDQTYDNLEIIVVDDNADKIWNKKVEEIISNSRAFYRIDVIYLKNMINQGSAETRNVGIRAASGDYITFLDDDDLYLPNKVKIQVEHMIENSADYSLSDLCLYIGNDILIEKRVRNYIKDYSVDSLLKYHLVHHMTGTDVMMFRKSYLFAIGLFPAINVGDEFYLMHKAIEGMGKFCYLPSCDVKAYVHVDIGGLSSGDGKIKGENDLFVYKKRYFNRLSKKEKRYIRMRHFAVIAYAELRRKNYILFTNKCMKSFIVSPIDFIKLILQRK
ncbi:MAG: glycosyl transferase family protein [Fusobacteria bacterium]|nr:MAG: glycosyl transferase family protein [Fusobacteriota bacterium]KAF0229245.1 MAG: glycosyl transferase family [Fusobacteriota bacterium]